MMRQSLLAFLVFSYSTAQAQQVDIDQVVKDCVQVVMQWQRANNYAMIGFDAYYDRVANRVVPGPTDQWSWFQFTKCTASNGVSLEKKAE